MLAGAACWPRARRLLLWSFWDQGRRVRRSRYHRWIWGRRRPHRAGRRACVALIGWLAVWLLRGEWLFYYPYPPYSPWPAFQPAAGDADRVAGGAGAAVATDVNDEGLNARTRHLVVRPSSASESMIQLSHVTYTYPDQTRAGAGRFLGDDPAGRVRAGGRAVGLGQVHVPAQPERAGAAFLRRALGRPRRGVRPRSGGAGPARHGRPGGLRLPGPGGAVRGGHGGGRAGVRHGELRPAAGHHAQAGRRGAGSDGHRPPAQTGASARSPAARSSASPSPRCWRCSPRCWCWTSRPRSSIRRPPRRCWSRCATSTRTWA